MKNDSKLRPVLRGIIWSTVVTIFFVLILALLMIMFGLGGTVTDILIQIIKILSIFFGVGMALKTVHRLGWLYGAIIGILYTLVAFLVFSAVDSEFSITSGILLEMLFAIIVGIFSSFLLRGFKSTNTAH